MYFKLIRYVSMVDHYQVVDSKDKLKCTTSAKIKFIFQTHTLKHKFISIFSDFEVIKKNAPQTYKLHYPNPNCFLLGRLV